MTLRSSLATLFISACCLLTSAPALHAQARQRTIFIGMYEAPMPSRKPDMYPSYPGAAMSTDGGKTWSSTGWATSTTNDLGCDPADPSMVYLANDWGLLRSTDAGRSWKQLTGWEIGAVLGVLPLPGALWVATAHGPYVSADGGTTWQKRTTGLSPLNGTYTSCIAAAGDTLLIGTADGVQFSTDHGIAWKQLGLGGISIENVIPDRVTPGRMIVRTTEHGLWVSDDGGRSWKDITASLPAKEVQAIALNPLKKNDMLAAVLSWGILHSEDGGITWKNVSGGLQNFWVTDLAFHPDDPSIVYAGTENGTFYSTNGGLSWAHSDVRLGYVSHIRFF